MRLCLILYPEISMSLLSHISLLRMLQNEFPSPLISNLSLFLSFSMKSSSMVSFKTGGQFKKVSSVGESPESDRNTMHFVGMKRSCFFEGKGISVKVPSSKVVVGNKLFNKQSCFNLVKRVNYRSNPHCSEEERLVCVNGLHSKRRVLKDNINRSGEEGNINVMKKGSE